MQRLDLSYYLVPLLGYESNYQVVSRDPTGSGMWSVEGGGELRYRASQALRLFLALDGMVRMPFKDSGLTEYLVELPAMLHVRLSPRWEIVLANYLGSERGKTPPVFIDPGEIDPALLGGANRTIRYTSVTEELQPLLALDLARWARLEAGPYLRVKWTTFLDQPWQGEPDYTLFDGAGSLAAIFRWQDRLSVRLRYDIARRLFSGWPARPPARQPVIGENLAMTRHSLGLRLRGRIWGPLGAQVGYMLRLITDNGGFYAATDHQPGGGLYLDTRRVDASVMVTYLRRDYTSRTPCEAEEDPPGSGKFVGQSCSGPPDVKPAPLPRWESGLVLDVRLNVSITSWRQAVLSYELDDARSDLEAVMNHRILAGIGFSH